MFHEITEEQLNIKLKRGFVSEISYSNCFERN